MCTQTCFKDTLTCFPRGLTSVPSLSTLAISCIAGLQESTNKAKLDSFYPMVSPPTPCSTVLHSGRQPTELRAAHHDRSKGKTSIRSSHPASTHHQQHRWCLHEGPTSCTSTASICHLIQLCMCITAALILGLQDDIDQTDTTKRATFDDVCRPLPLSFR